MFTGLVETTGVLAGADRTALTRLEIRSSLVAADVGVGDSVSVNGVCLTVNQVENESVFFYAMPETLRRTALGDLQEGDPVNLERAMSLGSRFGGHIVQGHVDGVGEVLDIRDEGGAEIWEFSAPESVLRYTVEKGSICVDGTSLTVVAVRGPSFTVSILPQTRRVTNFRALGVGDRVNLEADVIGKYVERLIEPHIGQTHHAAVDEMERCERSTEDAV
ncbi:MAG: riboflavin synthase [Rubrobacteraceae bacterium]